MTRNLRYASIWGIAQVLENWVPGGGRRGAPSNGRTRKGPSTHPLGKTLQHVVEVTRHEMVLCSLPFSSPSSEMNRVPELVQQFYSRLPAY